MGRGTRVSLFQTQAAGEMAGLTLLMSSKISLKNSSISSRTTFPLDDSKRPKSAQVKERGQRLTGYAHVVLQRPRADESDGRGCELAFAFPSSLNHARTSAERKLIRSSHRAVYSRYTLLRSISSCCLCPGSR